MKPSILLIITLTTLFSFCTQKTKSQQKNESKQKTETQKSKYSEKDLFNICVPSIKQGVFGCCTYKTGDCMPIIDTNKCKWYGVERTIFVYEAATESQTINEAPKPYPPCNWYKKINTKLIAKIQSDKNGCYQLELPSGEYTILILENNKIYCESWGEKYLCPVTIEKNKLTKRNLLIKMFVD